MRAAHIKVTSIDGQPVDGPEWITTEDGEHHPVIGPLSQLGDQMLADSERWFPVLHRSQHDAAVHFALGLAGEVGEVVNLVKKVNRGDKTFEDVSHDLGYEIADTLVYLLDLARSLGIDVDAALAEKRAICEERWG